MDPCKCNKHSSNYSQIFEKYLSNPVSQELQRNPSPQTTIARQVPGGKFIHDKRGTLKVEPLCRRLPSLIRMSLLMAAWMRVSSSGKIQALTISN